MIEVLLTDRCTGCDRCVTICPTNVFDRGADQPVIARPDDCQTCFLCELYCRADALYVGPNSEQSEPVVIADLLASGHLGAFRRLHGWDEWEGDPRYPNDHWYMDRVFLRARALASEEPARGR